MAVCSEDNKIAKWFQHLCTPWSHRGKESRVGDLNRKKLDMLRKWKSKYVTKANYLKLAEVFHNHDKNDLVAKLCDLLSSVEDDGKSLAIQGDWQDCWKRESQATYSDFSKVLY